MKRRRSIGYRIFDAVNVTLMLLFTFVVVYPFINQIAFSLNEGSDAVRGGIYFLPRKLTLDNYRFLFQSQDLLRGALVSVLRVVVGTVTGVFVTGLLAYITTVRSFSGRRLLRVLYVVTLYFGGGLIPTYLLIVRLGLVNTFTVYWLPPLISAFYMLLMAAYMQNIPESLAESARLDGCTEFRIYLQIIMPTSIPVFAAIGVYIAVFHWNSWFDNVLYNPSGTWDTLQVHLRRMLIQVEALKAIYNQQIARSRYRNLSPTTLKAAITIVVTIPITVVYPFLQRYFISGITLGAVKG
jgi:putative aldouronate transport system permease protein